MERLNPGKTMDRPLAASSIAVYQVGLLRLLGFIDRAMEHLAGLDSEASLLRRSLAKPLFPLGKQILAACRHAERDLARVAGFDVPAPSDTTMTLSALRQRVENVLRYVQTVGPASISDHIIVVFGRRAQKLNAVDYVRHYSVPHFYFHLSVVYVTLRMNGIPLGKTDFVKDVEPDLAMM